MPDDGSTSNPKRVAPRCGQQKILSENVVAIDDPSVGVYRILVLFGV